MTAIDNAKSYDWRTWLIGIMRSFLSGGAAALASLGGSGLAGLNLRQTLIVTGAGFVTMGLYRLGEFLTLHGAPDAVQASLNVAEDKAKDAVSAVQDAKKAATPIDQQ
jgi:hypothetical protein